MPYSSIFYKKANKTIKVKIHLRQLVKSKTITMGYYPNVIKKRLSYQPNNAPKIQTNIVNKFQWFTID